MMMNADLVVARAVALGCHAVLVYGLVSVAAAGAAAMGGLVVDAVAAAPSTLLNCAIVAMNSFEATSDASFGRIRSVATIVLGLVLLCCGGLVVSAAASSEISASDPSIFALIIVVSVFAFAMYAAVEFVLVVSSALVTAAAALVTDVVKAAPSAVKTFGDRIDAVMFKLVGKWVCNAFIPETAAPKVEAIPEKTRASAAPMTTRPSATVLPETKKPKKKTVSFGTVQVQEYRVTLGDHPLCKRYPMTLDWSHAEATEVELDALELSKSGKTRRRPAMTPRDRQIRIAEVTGVCPSVVQQKEHRRRRKLESANMMAVTRVPTHKPKKSVSFGTVEIREYSLTLGDHPCCDSYPLSLDWGHTNAKTYDLDLLEQQFKSATPRPDLTPKQRLTRIAAVTGYDATVVEKKERRRIRKQQEEAKQAVADRQLPAIAKEASTISSVRRSGMSLGGYHEV